MEARSKVDNPTELRFQILDTKMDFVRSYAIEPTQCHLGRRAARWLRKWSEKTFGAKNCAIDGGTIYDMKITTDLTIDPRSIVISS